jgi:hypothetical protein
LANFIVETVSSFVQPKSLPALLALAASGDTTIIGSSVMSPKVAKGQGMLLWRKTTHGFAKKNFNWKFG